MPIKTKLLDQLAFGAPEKQQISVVVIDDIVAKAEEIAESVGRPKSEVYRLALDEGMARIWREYCHEVSD